MPQIAEAGTQALPAIGELTQTLVGQVTDALQAGIGETAPAPAPATGGLWSLVGGMLGGSR